LALFALGLHLPGYRFDNIGQRHGVLDLDAVDLDAPRRYRGIGNAEQTSSRRDRSVVAPPAFNLMLGGVAVAFPTLLSGGRSPDAFDH
jgi:hypothetical protein